MQARSAMCAIGSQETTRPSSGNAITWSKPLTARHQVRVGELHALGRPGGARGVDQREQVVGLDGAPGGLEVEALRRRAARRRRSLVDDDHVLDPVQRPHAVDERLLGHDDARLGVVHLVLDLLGRVGVVDRERRGAEVQRGGVEPVELGPVGEHDPQRRRRARGPRPASPAATRAHLVGVLAPGDRELVVLRAQRAAVGMGLRRELEGLGHRGGVEPGAAAPVAASVVTAMCVT